MECSEMKKVISLVLALAMVIGVFALSGCGKETNGSINVLSLGDYIDMNILKTFEKETGIKVKYDELPTNEDIYTKLQTSSVKYDVLCLSDYMIERLIKENRLLEINFDNLPEAKKNIGETYWKMSEEFDPDRKYNVPHFYGAIGILYNSKKVDEEKVQSWNVLWDEAYSQRIIMQNSMREAFIVPLTILGYDINTTNIDELNEAKEMLIKQKPLVQRYLVDEARDEVIAENADLAVVYSGEAYIGTQGNPDLRFVIPKEGSSFWFDSWVIPDTCRNKEGAEMFLNFLCRKDIATLNFEAIYYSTPNQAVIDSLDDELRNNPELFLDDEELARCYSLKYLGQEIADYYSQAWKEIKAE